MQISKHKEQKNIKEASSERLILDLFATKINDLQEQQIKIFDELKKDLPLTKATQFKNQVNFQKSNFLPVQRWFPYREGYSVELVKTFIKELNIKGLVFDPFAGSGTTLLAARHSNVNSIGFDVNPISVLVAKVENDIYDANTITILKQEIEKFKTINEANEHLETKFELADKVFNKDILQTLLQTKNHIKNIANSKVKNLFFVAWLSIVEEVSNIKKEGNGIKYKNRKRTKQGYINIDKEVWEKQHFPQDKFEFVKLKITNQVKKMLVDLVENYGPVKCKPVVYNNSCLEFDKHFSDSIDFTFYSPPYCNCFDYFEIHKVELWLGEFVKNRNEFKQLRNTGFRSNTNSLNHKIIEYNNQSVENLISMFEVDKLWNKKIPNVIRGYFDDTKTLLQKIYKQTKKDGYCGIVVGNSAYTGVIIPTDLIICDIAKEIGFKVEKFFITRHLTTSSQQKKQLEFLKDYLRESIILLKK